MDLKDHLLQIKRYFEAEIGKYNGPDPLKLRCDYLFSLENYDRCAVADIYLPALEETLTLFKDDNVYKQDVRFIRLWLNYAATQGNIIEIIKTMHNKGLGTECSLLYSTWAENLLKNGHVSSANNIYKMGMGKNLKDKRELQIKYDEFLKEIGQMVVSGKLLCPKCNCSYMGSGEIEGSIKKSFTEEVEVWEWNPLPPGMKDDFTCPIAYFEEPDPTKIRMYPKDKVYPSKNEEYSLEELMAEEYEKKYRAEEALRLKAEEEAARRAREEQNELRKKEAEKIVIIEDMPLPVKATIPINQNLLSVPKDIDNSAYTVHTKEAMCMIQDMWSSPSPKAPSKAVYNKCSNPHGDMDPPPVVVAPKSAPVQIYTDEDDEPVKQPPPPPKPQPFQIYDENAVQRTNSRLAVKGKVQDENEPPENELFLSSKQPVTLKSKAPFEIYTDDTLKTPDGKVINNEVTLQKENFFSNTKFPITTESAGNLADKLGNVKLQQMFNLPNQTNDDFSNVTCNTKAFDFVLPSSTPLSLHKKSMNLHKSEGPPNRLPGENSNLSVILEQSKEKSGSSSASNGTEALTKTPKSASVLQSVPELYDPFSSTTIEELLEKIDFPKPHSSKNYFVKQNNLPFGTKTMKLGDDTYIIQGEIGKGAYAKVLRACCGNNTVALKIEKPACKWEYYIAKEIQNRVPPEMAPAFMDIKSAHIFINGSVLTTTFAKYGTLLSSINLVKEKTGRCTDLGVVLHFAIELIDIVDHLHKTKIIHADLKADNIVIREIPAHNEDHPCLQLIDFGRCIDMSLFPPGTQFSTVFKTEDNKCVEMKENKPWSYQIDLQGLASIFYCLLAADYMKTHKKNDRWTLQKQLPRHMRREIWNPIFDALLNVNPSTDLPFNFTPMRESLQQAFNSSANNHLQQLSLFKNCIFGIFK